MMPTPQWQMPPPHRYPPLWADESPLNDLDEAAHETEELPDEADLIEAVEHADDPSPPPLSDPSQL